MSSFSSYTACHSPSNIYWHAYLLLSSSSMLLRPILHSEKFVKLFISTLNSLGHEDYFCTYSRLIKVLWLYNHTPSLIEFLLHVSKDSNVLCSKDTFSGKYTIDKMLRKQFFNTSKFLFLRLLAEVFSIKIAFTRDLEPA